MSNFLPSSPSSFVLSEVEAAIVGALDFKNISFDPATPTAGARSQAAHVLGEGLRNARVESAVSEITLSPVGWVRLGDVAEVREGDKAGEFVIDFQAMRTVSGVAYNAPSGTAVSPTVNSVRVWTGTAFADDKIEKDAPDTRLSLGEQFTERLLVAFGNFAGLTADLLRTNGTVNVPSPPSEIELKINDRVVWAHPKAVKLDGETGVFEETVDIAADLTEALESGAWPISVTVTSGVPCLMTLSNQIAYQRRHAAELPGGGIVVNADAVGEQTAAIPLPDGNADWSVHEVVLTVSADLPAIRTLPADPPRFSETARLALDSDHIVILRVPPSLRKRFRKVERLSLPLEATGDGGEITAVFYAGSADAPAAKPTGVTIPPVKLVAADGVQWIDLPLSEAIPGEGGGELWLEVNMTRGQAFLFPAAMDDSTETAAETAVMRGVAGGPWKPFKVVLGGNPLAIRGALRLSGTPFSAADLPAAVPFIEGVDETFSGFTPERNGTEHSLAPTEPATSDGGSIADDALNLRFRFQVPGIYRITDAVVFYTLGSETAGGAT
ncbi:MAG: hypothetical protein ACOC98_03805 [Thermodesulfobacteriota bacterium]